MFLFSWISVVTGSVSYDSKAILINGKRRILLSGSIHYPRSTPEMWPGLIQKAKVGGLDVIQTYVFWNGHEPSPGKFYFEGRYDLVQFIKLVQKAGLYVHLRIGPFVCAEWNFGGFPVWLKFVPGIVFRQDNEPFKAAMRAFTEKIVNMMKAENLFEPQGGPIILSQIENEYELMEYDIGKIGKDYANWAAQMAVGLNTYVPWVMCKQEDAPDPIINTCNGFYCENFYPNKNYKPKMWTEAWSGWLLEFGGPFPYRPVEDLAFAVAKFIQNSGTFVNYYMYHGGTNFGRTSGRFVATSYDYDSPIDEYGLAREPKWSHLRDLHKAIKLCEPALLYANPTVTSLGQNQEAHVFEPGSGTCAAFLANYDADYSVTVNFRNMQYDLPPWSVSILPDCKNVNFNTAKVSTPGYQAQMVPVNGWKFYWQSYTEACASVGDKKSYAADGLKEQLSSTWDNTDYLWYMTDITIDSNEGFLKNGQLPSLTVESAGHAIDVYINGQLSGTAYGRLSTPNAVFSDKVNLKAGTSQIALLSSAVGLQNVGTHFEQWNIGILGPVTLEGLNSGTWDMSKWKWSYKIGVGGEDLNLYTAKGSSAVNWVDGSGLAINKPLTWYKAIFDAPDGNEPLALDMNTMGKGEIWINGNSIGRHWPGVKGVGNCNKCSYAGLFNETKCLNGCGQPSQRWYHLPRSWLLPKWNTLVIFEQWGGDPRGISLVKRI
ncbi:hypothetical protein DITRI_Ditri10aG0084600 [Diplodiscus trichospermus]